MVSNGVLYTGGVRVNTDEGAVSVSQPVIRKRFSNGCGVIDPVQVGVGGNIVERRWMRSVSVKYNKHLLSVC